MANVTGLKQIIYAERYGDLYWHKFVGAADGRKLWAPGFGRIVGKGFNVYKPLFVFGTGFGGVIYGVKPNGELFWHRHDGAENGTPEWGEPGVRGSPIADDWDVYTLVFGIWNVLYGITPDGGLHWHRHDGWLDGSATWAPGSGRQIGTGWHFDQVFACGSPGGAVLYCRNKTGDLYWYRHAGWATGGPALIVDKQYPGASMIKVGTGWNSHRTLFSQSPGEFPGIIYGVGSGGNLNWYRHDGWADGSPSWTAGDGGRTIESGPLGGTFGSYNTAFAGHHRLYAQGEEGPVLPVTEVIKPKRPRFPP